jgi:hypothetical protein
MHMSLSFSLSAFIRNPHKRKFFSGLSDLFPLISVKSLVIHRFFQVSVEEKMLCRTIDENRLHLVKNPNKCMRKSR